MRLRLKYAGAAEDSVRVVRSESELVEAVTTAGGQVCILPTYTAMLPLRAALAAKCGRKEFWK